MLAECNEIPYKKFNTYLDVVDEVELLKEDPDAVSRDLDWLSSGRGAEKRLHDVPLGEA